MNSRLIFLCLIPLLAGCDQTVPVDGSYILSDAIIYTVDEEVPVAEAMAVIDGKVAMVGHLDDVQDTYPDLPLSSAGGRAVVPGFTDAHAHFVGLGSQRLRANLRGTGTIEEAISILKDYESTLSEGDWLLGRGWNQALWPDREFPTRQDLDVHFPNRPVWLGRIDGHAAWANTQAMNMAGFEEISTMKDPIGGSIIRDDEGIPTGIFVDSAMTFVRRVVPSPSEEFLDSALDIALAEAAQVGLTGVHDAGIGPATINRYKRFIDEDRFTVRLYGMVSGGSSAFDEYCNNHLIDYGERLTIRSVKFALDGALGSRGAALIEDYSDDPGNRGLIRTTPEEFNERVQEAVNCGYQVNTHAIGDMGNRVLLDAYELAGVTPEGRHRDEHTQIVELSEIERFTRLGIIASMQPTHATSDLNMAEDRLGPHRIKGGYAWRTLLDAGVPLAFGSDFPVEKANPLLGFFASVTRQTEDLLPEGGWYPEERLTREETLYAFTKGAAWAAFQDDQLGSLAPGNHADFVVLSNDIMTVAAPQILETEVVATFFGGNLIYGSLE